MQEASQELVQRSVQEELLDELTQRLLEDTESAEEAFDTAALLLVAVCLYREVQTGECLPSHEELGRRVAAALNHLTRKH